MRLWDKFANLFKAQGMPKYQNLYLGDGCSNIMISYSNEIVSVKGCHYSSSLASYVYWVEANGVSVPVPERYLKPIK